MAKTALWTWALVLLFTWVSPAVPMKVTFRSSSYSPAHPRKHINSICSTWGKDHFKTFDGDIYQFPGRCEYNLVSDCHEAAMRPDFAVQMKRTEVAGHSTVSELVVYIKDRVIVLSKNLVMVDAEKISTPYYGAGFSLKRNTIYTKLQSKLGLSVMWNGEDAITLELDSKYQNRTCGLCGDFNGIPVINEFVEGGRNISAIEFGNRQEVHVPHDCEDVPEEDEFEGDELEDTGLDKCANFHDGCARLLQSDDWWSCTRVLSPAPYIRACMQDMCSCGDALDDFCNCSTLAEYSRQCSHMGGTPPNWRSQGFCEKRCPLNMVYMESGSPCINTCTNTDTSQLCEEHHMDGCVCPEGTVFDDISERGCIRQEQCQCVHGKAYNSGEVLRQECEECVCIQGKWSCNSLPCPGQCAIEGGSHVTTYDGKAFTFHGDCLYILTKDQVGSKFTVLGQLAPCGSQDLDTCLKSVILLPKNDAENPLKIADGRVWHNAEISLPYKTANVHVFRPSSFYIMVQTDFGLSLHIQLVPIMQLYITLDQTYRTNTSGLCGNFNKILHDDLKAAQGLVEGTAASCANSWKAQPSCPNRMERIDDPCSLSIENEKYAEHWCSMLQSPKSEFSNCHTVVHPEVFYRRCKYSTCNCEKSEDCLCAVFSSYVRACQAKGVDLQGWRSEICGKYMDTCPTSQAFSYQLRQCQRTCRSLGSERPSCSTDFLPVDGCSCPEGLYQDDNGVCVPMAQCLCYRNGDHIKPGKSITIKEEHCVCTNGTLHCRAWKARSESTRCPSPKVFFSCSSANANVRGIECARTCSNLDGDCFSADCESGCQCPSGLLDDGRGNCVKEHDCPCPHDNQLYAPGRTIPNRCNMCTCTRGKWSCTDHVCPGACTIYGSGHHMTFDEQTFAFRGDCGYVAVQDKCGNMTGMGNFRVITENIPCGSTGTTCSKAVRIYLGSTALRLSDGKVEEITRNDLTFVDHKVRKVGLFILVESRIGISVVWDRKTTVRIVLKPEHMGKVCGLCGDFDGDARDDFTTQGQLVVSSPMEFANSWKVSACNDTVGEVDPCSLNPHRHSWAMLQCSIIKSGTFKDCHPKVDPILYYENCVSDSCACDSGGDCECFCTAVAAYAQACNEAGVCVAWRTPDLCPVYCDYFNAPHECKWHYSPCHTPCYKTCLNPQGICSNPLPNMEGCYPTCPPDKPIFDETNQICAEECDSCIINGIEYPPGAEVPTDELCTTCICMGYGNVTCEHVLGCCVYNGTEYEEGEIIYNVTYDIERSIYAICKNETIIHQTETFTTTPRPTTTVTSTTETPTTTPVSTSTTETPTTTPVSTSTTETPTTTPVSTSTTETPTPTTTPVITSTTEAPTPPTTTPGITTTTETPTPTTTAVITTTTETPTPTTTPVSTTTTETLTPTTTPVSTSTTETPTPTTTPVITSTTEAPTPTTTPVSTTTTETPTPPTTTPVSTTTTETPKPTTTPVITTTTETQTPSPPTTTPVVTTTTETPTPQTTTPVSTTTTETPTPTTTPGITTTTETPTTTAVITTTTETPTPTTTPVSTTTTETPKPTTSPVSTTTTLPLVTGRPPPTGPVIIITTPCFCILNGNTYHPGATIVNMTSDHIGFSHSCFTMICSDVCKIEKTTYPCPPPTLSTPTATPSTKPPGCPEWGVAQYETFRICNCTMAVCIENNLIEIIPNKCPPLNEDLICTNGMKPVLEWDEYHCCQQYKCDCVCKGWGDPHYLTFDGVFYSFQGDCSYVLMEENIAKHKLKIYIENVHCDPSNTVSCPRAIIVDYKADHFVLTSHNFLGVLDLEAYINGPVHRSLPYLADNVKIFNTGIDLVLEIPALNVVITYGITRFSIHLPFRHFGANTQGQCGTCNNNQADDCMLPGGQLMDCSLFGDYWVDDCVVPPALPRGGPILIPTDKPCGDNHICDLLKSSIFEECHAVISPEPYFRGCAFDSCHIFNPMVECTSLEIYAAACLGSGVCLDWRYRTNKCPYACPPPDKEYKSCGPAQQPTCEDTSKDPSMRYMTEGCFCPDGMRLFNKESGVCVEKCGCLDPNRKPREFNEVFQYECQNCICDQATKSVTCQPMHCPGPEVIICNKPGFVNVNETNPANPCCTQLVCQCDGSTCPTIYPKCKEGYNPVLNVPEGGCCPKFICEPKKVCVHHRVEYQPGASIPVSDCQECTCTTEVDLNNGLYTIKCSAVTCGQDCEPGFRYIETAEDLCCGKCVQTHCMVQVDGRIQLLQHGHTWSPPGNKCEVHSCLRINGTFVSMQSNIRCPTFNKSRCLPGTIQKSADGCCDVCVEMERACKVESTKKRILLGHCQSVEEVDVTYCEGACNTFTKYNAASVFMRQSCTCCQESQTSNRTVNLLCVNGEMVPHSYVHVEECGCKVADCSPLNKSARPFPSKRLGRSLP